LANSGHVTGTISGMDARGVFVSEERHIDADIVVNCVGFERNASLVPSLCDYREMTNINYIDKDFMYLADAYIDDDAFNSFFGSSVLEMAKFYLNVFLRFFDSPEYEEMMQTDGVEKIDIESRAWSQYIAGAAALIARYDDLRQKAREQVDQRSKNFMEAGKTRLNGDTQREANTDEVRSLRNENDTLKKLLAELYLEKEMIKKSQGG